jgi:hypothetical protein
MNQSGRDSHLLNLLSRVRVMVKVQMRTMEMSRRKDKRRGKEKWKEKEKERRNPRMIIMLLGKYLMLRGLYTSRSLMSIKGRR